MTASRGFTATYANLFGEHEDGCAKRTVEAGSGFQVDLDDTGRIIGVETIGDDTDWRNALAVLAMQGRLVVPRQAS